ncbi:hypothetical protein V1517DRAFT_320614 [Lipomyces orientalis]|uniref:Uncharacterized protein n=1 Tax=Lipomyces orientalis TaxID=1233043 RepID=A0ACC3TRR6_9ASCO
MRLVVLRIRYYFSMTVAVIAMLPHLVAPKHSDDLCIRCTKRLAPDRNSPPRPSRPVRRSAARFSINLALHVVSPQ